MKLDWHNSEPGGRVWSTKTRQHSHAPLRDLTLLLRMPLGRSEGTKKARSTTQATTSAALMQQKVLRGALPVIFQGADYALRPKEISTFTKVRRPSLVALTRYWGEVLLSLFIAVSLPLYCFHFCMRA